MELATVSGWVLLVVVCLPLVSAGLSGTTSGWQLAKVLSAINLLMAVALWLGVAVCGLAVHAAEWITLNPLRATLLLLVSFIAHIVLHYAHRNFLADVDATRFLRWLTCTIFAVELTLVSNHLAIFWMAWVLISLSMHKLLVFYPQRYRAVLAAHKKFIFARTAEFLLACAFALLYYEHKTALITDILQQQSTHSVSSSEQVAAVLLALVALIKCAQLPLHGWLIQVVESPTPVSALLHAGVINLGGFLLLLFAPLFSQAPAAQWLVIGVAGLTASFAALVMMTRISIKVRLAWSTTAQMGLMLVECALGLYELALLHLVAHSCYKAYAFLNSGSAVSDYIQNQYAGNTQPRLGKWLVATALALGIVAPLCFVLHSTPPFSPWLLLTIALAVSISVRLHQQLNGAVYGGIFEALVLAGLYVLFKFAAGFVWGPVEHAYNGLADTFISVVFIVVLLIHVFFELKPLNPISQKLFIALNAGLYLDEWSTRLTLWLWPIRLRRQQSSAAGSSHLHNRAQPYREKLR